MFGYVMFNRQEMKLKDYELYRSYYCGLCRELRERHGIPGQISLTYDMTFVVLLLGGVYEPPVKKGTTRCIIAPFKPHTVRKTVITEYAADMNVILTYYKCLDDWNDEKKAIRLAYAKLLKRTVTGLDPEYADKIRRITGCLSELTRLEKQGDGDLDHMAGVFGRLMGEIFAWRQDEWTASLRRMGFYLGKFIYLLDAYDDLEKDRKTGSYNPFADKWKPGEDPSAFEKEIRSLLIMMMSEACREFEQLPVIRYGDILRNVLYSGVWLRFEAIGRKRREKWTGGSDKGRPAAEQRKEHRHA